MASTLVQPPAPIRFGQWRPRYDKMWTLEQILSERPPPALLPMPSASTHSSSTPSVTPNTPVKQPGVVVFSDDKPAATPSTAPADIDRLLSTAPTAIPRPIAFVQPQKAINARPQHSTPFSPATPPTTTPAATALPITQRATSSPVTPTVLAPSTPLKSSHTNGIHTPLTTKLASSSPKLTPSPRLSPITASTSLTAVDDNIFHPSLHRLFSPSQLPELIKWPADITGPGSGFHNLGNSCFMNATLQALTHTPMLANYCRSHQHSQHCPIKHAKPLPPPPPAPAPPKTSVFGFGNWRPQLAFQSLFQQQPQPQPPFCLFCALEENIIRSFKQSGAFAPSNIFNRLPTISRSLRRGRQEDAHEFLRLAFDMLQSNVLALDLPSRPVSSSCLSQPAAAVSKAPLPLPKGSSVPSALFATLTPAQLHRIKETSVLYQIFSGYYCSTLTCRSCHQPSHTFEPFLDLSLSIPTASAPGTSLSSGFNRFSVLNSNRPYQPAFSANQPPQPPLTLHQCLRAFTSEEQLDTDNMYKCTTCKKKTRAAKRLTIHTAPNVLVVHLKRFEHSGLGMSGGGGKIGRMVRFDTVLDLGEYMSERGSAVNGKVEYELYGVLVHAGSTLYSGHYYSFVKAADGRWYEMNDSSVQPRTVEEVLAQKAYILFYTRKAIDTGVKGAAARSGGGVGAGAKVVKESGKEVEGKKEKVAAPISVVNGVAKDKSANELIKALMKGKAGDAVATPHLNGHSVKVVDEKKEQASERVVVHERKEERKKVVEEETKAELVTLAAAELTERAAESTVTAADDKREEQEELREEKEEKKVDGSRISLARTTIHQTTVHISLLTPASSSAPTASAHLSNSLVIPLPSSPLSPPSALSSPVGGGGSSKRKQMNGSSPPASGTHPGMPSFRAGSQAKFTAFAATATNGSQAKKVKRESLGNGMAASVKLVPYSSSSSSSSSSSDDEEQQEERKESHNGVHNPVVEAEKESKLERKEEAAVPATPAHQHEEKAAADPATPPTAPTPTHTPAADEQKRELHYTENNDRKRRRLDIEAATQPAAAPTINTTRFDPHAARHTAHSHYGTEVGTWEDDEKGQDTEQERRERDGILRRLERERRGRGKDEYDVMYDEGKKRKVRGDKDEWQGVAAKEGENLLQREQERREGRGDSRRDEQHRPDARRHSDNRSSHRDGARQSNHHRHRDDRGGGRDQHQQHHRDRRQSSSSPSSHRDTREPHHSHRNRGDNDRDRSKHSWSHK